MPPEGTKCLSLEMLRPAAGWALVRDVIEKGPANIFYNIKAW